MIYSILWRVHAILMSSSFLAMFCGILISLIFKKKKWRYETHKRLGIYAGASGITALIIGVTMVQISRGVHFTSLHAILGGITGLLLITTPFAGLNIRKVKNKKRMKLIHKSSGYITLLMMAVTVYSGLLFTGIISRASGEEITGTDSAMAMVPEEENSVTSGSVTFSWSLTDDYLEAEMKAPVEGWVAVGFNPSMMMEGADFIIGYVENGQGYLRDDYGSWLTSHDSDEKLGGTDNAELLDFGEDSTGTWLRFRIPLQSGDEYDHKFIPGETITVIFATSNKDGFSGMHQTRGSEDLTF